MMPIGACGSRNAVVDPRVELVPHAVSAPYAECFDMYLHRRAGARVHAKFVRPATRDRDTRPCSCFMAIPETAGTGRQAEVGGARFQRCRPRLPRPGRIVRGRRGVKGTTWGVTSSAAWMTPGQPPVPTHLPRHRGAGAESSWDAGRGPGPCRCNGRLAGWRPHHCLRGPGAASEAGVSRLSVPERLPPRMGDGPRQEGIRGALVVFPPF